MNKNRNPQLVILGNPLGQLGQTPEEAYSRFHWTDPESVLEVPRPEGVSAPALILVGHVQEIIYSTIDQSERSKISKLWSHTFKDPPLLCTTPNGDVLVILGGNLMVTPRGIEG